MYKIHRVHFFGMKIQENGGVILKQKKLFSLLFSLILFSMVLSACSSGGSEKSSSDANNDSDKGTSTEPQDGGNLVLGLTGDPELFNPYYSSDTTSMEIAGHIFNGLVTMDRNFNPVPDLAKKWEHSKDGKTWTFYLREDVKWHDGKPFTADDVVFSWGIPRDEDYTGAYAYTYQNVKKVKKIDDYTVKIVLKERDASFINIPAVVGILPKHILKDVPIAELGKNDFNRKNPIGTGPYKLKEWKHGQYLKLVANEDYFKGRPHIDSLTYKIVPDENALMANLQAGEMDMVGISPTYLKLAKKLEKEGQINLLSGPDNGYWFLSYNLRSDLFNDKKVRQALTHAIDREKIVKSILHGAGHTTNGPGSPANWAYTTDVPKFEYNPEVAKEMLAKAGWVDTSEDGILDKNGKKFSFSISVSNSNEALKKIAQVMQQEFKQVGIEAKVHLLDHSAFLEQIRPPESNFDVYLGGWTIGSDPDPTYFWHSSQIENGLNYGAYSNPKVDKLLEKNINILDQDKRKKVIAKAFKQVAEDQPYMFLYYETGYQAITSRLHGPEYSASNSWYKVQDWWLEPK